MQRPKTLCIIINGKMGILEIIILVFTLLMMLIGLLGIVIPNLPGEILIWTGVFFYGTLTRFEVLDKNFILFVTSLTLLAILIEYTETIWGKKKINNGFRGLIGGILGGLIGGTSGNMTMMIIGTFLGAAFGLILSGRDPIFTVETKDFKVILYVGSTIIKIAIGVIIIESFVVKVFF